MQSDKRRLSLIIALGSLPVAIGSVLTFGQDGSGRAPQNGSGKEPSNKNTARRISSSTRKSVRLEGTTWKLSDGSSVVFFAGGKMKVGDKIGGDWNQVGNRVVLTASDSEVSQVRVGTVSSNHITGTITQKDKRDGKIERGKWTAKRTG